ncbi:MAG: hypothetical protein IPP94_16975 [Ignavibacteria bacterium]|nr:hypothetical protein [Ignavibacteria bacterium]
MQKVRYGYMVLCCVAALSSVRAQEAGISGTLAIPSPSVARQFHYQGCLNKPDGTPQPDGAYQMKFEILDQAVNIGAVLFSESASITTKKGLFEHAIGSVDTAGNKLDPHIFQRRVALRLTVNNETLLPLIPIYTTPIAMVALYADSLKQPLPPGPQGPPGVPGAKGADGIDCWDLNGNGAGDPAEDKNADGKWDALDCQGPRGPAGPPGGGGGKDTVSIVRTDSLVVLTLSEHYGPEYFIYEDPVTKKKDTTRIHGGQFWITDGKGGVAVSFDQDRSVHNIPELYIYTDPVTGHKDTTKLHGGQILIGDGRGGSAVLFDQEKSEHNVPEYYIYTTPTGRKDTTTIHGGELSTNAISVYDGDGNLKVGFDETGSYHEVPEMYVHVDPLTGKRDTTVIDGGTITGRNIGVVNSGGTPVVTFDQNRYVHRVPEFYISTDPSTGKADTTTILGSQVVGSSFFVNDAAGRTVGQWTPNGFGVFQPGSLVIQGGISQTGHGFFRGISIADSAGTTATYHDSRGHSFHYQPETYYAGVTVPLQNGNIMRLDPVEGLTIKNPTGGFVGHLNPVGNFFFVGTKNNIIPTASYGTRQMYAVEAPDVRYTDYGSSRLANGEAVVRLDPIFLETVTIDDVHPMIVSLTPAGDCRGLYVAGKGRDHFVVRELGGGVSSTPFDWQVVVKRRGYESARMEEYQRAATREEMATQQQMPAPVPPAFPVQAVETPVLQTTDAPSPAKRALPALKKSSRRSAPAPVAAPRNTVPAQERSPR